jgi:hypothetical protein
MVGVRCWGSADGGRVRARADVNLDIARLPNHSRGNNLHMHQGSQRR